MELVKFLNALGINTTTNFNLKDIAKELNIKVKVLMKDELLKSKKTNNKCCDKLSKFKSKRYTLGSIV